MTTPADLRAAREILGLSQRAMAPKIDVSQRTLRRMEAGEAPIKRGTWKLVEELLAEQERTHGLDQQ